MTPMTASACTEGWMPSAANAIATTRRQVPAARNPAASKFTATTPGRGERTGGVLAQQAPGRPADERDQGPQGERAADDEPRGLAAQERLRGLDGSRDEAERRAERAGARVAVQGRMRGTAHGMLPNRPLTNSGRADSLRP